MEIEYRIASYILNGVFSHSEVMVNYVMKEFDISREECISILGSKSFNKTLDALIRLRDMVNEATMLNILGEIMYKGNHKEKMFAIEIVIYLLKHQYSHLKLL